MTRPTVYLETSVISYLTARPSRDLVVAAHQQITREWWETAAPRYELFISQLVVQEITVGDAQAVVQRLQMISGLPLLALVEETRTLARILIASKCLPSKFVEDALHIAVATVHGMDYLLTWNCKHIANAFTRGMVEKTCRAQGYEPPVICTPEELMEE